MSASVGPENAANDGSESRLASHRETGGPSSRQEWGKGDPTVMRRPGQPDGSEGTPPGALLEGLAPTSPLTVRKATRRRQRWGLLGSFLAIVAIPSAVAAAYYLFAASDQYVTEVRFALRSVERTATHDVVGATTGLPSAVAGIADSFIIADYVTTRQFVDEVDGQVGLRRMLAHPGADAWSRLDPSAPVEELVRHWRSIASARYELSTGILSVKVRAFTPDDSFRLAEAVIASSEKLANDLTIRGRRDFVRFAETELKSAEHRLREAREELGVFRRTEGTFDPLRAASSSADLSAKLRSDLAAMRAEVSAFAATMHATAPPILTLNARIGATEQQLRDAEADGMRSAGRAGADTGSLLARYGALEAEQAFAEKSYGMAAESLRSARGLADRQQVYLATYARPALPQSPQFPNRPSAIGLVVGLALLIWLVGVLVVLGVRDHLR